MSGTQPTLTITATSDLMIIHGALLIAREQYMSDARGARLANQPRLAEQFEKQAERAVKLAEGFDCPDSVAIYG